MIGHEHAQAAMITAKFGVPRLRGLALTSPMSTPRYVWRQLNQIQREELLSWRKERGYPWHSPPHRPNFGHLRFLISASCFEHRHTSATAQSEWTIFRVIR